ncbi:DNA primase [Enterococcus phage vB_EFaS_TV51]|uniref:DNA primase n=1 Tax=Enterococcus phage vB_EFaS_TV51 TaxID=2759207 RepID=A0A7S6GHG2_9CAUD|nr:DNA primase [Enterococcus phage vB_EFaS_TV51]
MVNELQKVEYDQPIELSFISTLEKTLTPSKQYIKALSEYEKDHKEWEVDFKNGDAAKNAEPQRPEPSYDGLNAEALAVHMAKVLPVHASSTIGLPVVYNHDTKIYEVSEDNLEARLWQKLYNEFMMVYTPHYAENAKVANQFRNAVQRMAKNALASGANLPFNDKMDPNKIAFKNGTYRFKEDTLKPTVKEDYQTTRIEYDYIENPKHNIVAEWIEYILEEDAKTLFQLIGRIFYRNQDPQAMVFATGEGSNGKSHVMAFIEELVGKSNTSHATLASLSGNNDKFASSQLFGKMVNIETDMPAQHIKQTGTLKTLSGNDVMSAEYKGINKFTFTNYALMIFTTNNMPTFSDTSHGFLRRIITLPFNKTMGRDNPTDSMWLERSKNFTYEEKSEFISYCLQQYRNVLFGLNGETKGHFWTSDNANKLRDAFIQGNDTMANFIDMNEMEFVEDENSFIPTNELLEAYNDMLLNEGLMTVSARKFVPELQRKSKNIVLNRVKKRVNGTPQYVLTNIKWGNNFTETDNIF